MDQNGYFNDFCALVFFSLLFFFHLLSFQCAALCMWWLWITFFDEKSQPRLHCVHFVEWFFFRSRNVTFERLVISLRTILMDMMCVWAFNTCIFDLFCAVLHEMAQGNDNKITWCSSAYLIRLGHPRDNTFTVMENWQMKWNDH